VTTTLTITSVTTTLTIAGMTSVHAVRAVFTSLAGVEGIARADVSIGRAVIDHDGRATPDRLARAVALAGYEVVAWEERRTLPTL
jgi:copper chaperone CopZ